MIDWSPLRAALGRYRADNLALPIWWRDDDAVARTPELDQLTRLAQDLDMPVHLAVIPAHAEIELPKFMAQHPLLFPLVHGWAHENTAPAGQKKSEFGTPRSDALEQAQKGFQRMQTLFGSKLIPMFVPPWNRIDAGLLAQLAGLGFRAISTFGPRPASTPLLQINTHIDPIYWRGHRSLVDPSTLIAKTVELLEARRTSTQDAAEPLGYLTHHLVHDDPIWEFSRAFLSELRNGGAAMSQLKDHIK